MPHALQKIAENMRRDIGFTSRAFALTWKLNPDGTPLSPTLGLPAGYIWVRREGGREATRAKNPGVVSITVPNTGVEIGINTRTKETEVIRVAPEAITQLGVNLTNRAATPDLLVDHNNLPIAGEMIQDLRVHRPDVNHAGLYVQIEPGLTRYGYLVLQWLSVASALAPTSGMRRWALIYVDTDATVKISTTGSVETSTPANGMLLDNGGSLTAAAMENLTISAGWIPLAAIVLDNGQTAVDDTTKIVGWSYFRSEMPGTSGGSIAVDDGTTTVDPTTQLTFDPAYFDVTDPGGGQAMVTFVGGGFGGNVSVGTYGTARPASPSAGDMFVPTDGVWNQEVYDGADWRPMFSGALLTVPPSASWSWDNQGSATIDSALGALYLFVPAGTTALSQRLRYRTAPSAPYTITVRVEPNLLTGAQPYISIGFRESSSGKLHALLVSPDVSGGKPGLFSAKFTTSTAFSASYAGTVVSIPHAPYWLQISDDNTNRILRYSNDGKHFLQLNSIGRTDFLTADQVYFGCAPVDTTFDSALTIYSWAVT